MKAYMDDDLTFAVSVSEYGALVCNHSARTAIRKRTLSNGSTAMVRQCQTCGADLGAIKKGSPEVLALATVEAFDDTLAANWRMQCQLHREERIKRREEEEERERLARHGEYERERLARHGEYEAYLRTDAWHRKRAIVLERAGDLCEGCGLARAVHVHHLTYKHLGDEFLWELKAVCLRCHEKAHPDATWGKERAA